MDGKTFSALHDKVIKLSTLDVPQHFYTQHKNYKVSGHSHNKLFAIMSFMPNKLMGYTIMLQGYYMVNC